MSTAALGIDYFSRENWLTAIQARVSLGVRREMFEIWCRFAASSPFGFERIIDVGTTPDFERLDSNCMVRWLRDLRAKVTLYSIEPIGHMSAIFPGSPILQGATQAEAIPCSDRQFDWAFSSATLEHVGGRERQVKFIQEMGRVADGVFLTTPSRMHWLEFHTKLPFIHWLPRRFHRLLLRALGYEFWSEEANLRLLSARELREMAVQALGDGFKIDVLGVNALGMRSNLILVAQRRMH